MSDLYLELNLTTAAVQATVAGDVVLDKMYLGSDTISEEPSMEDISSWLFSEDVIGDKGAYSALFYNNTSENVEIHSLVISFKIDGVESVFGWGGNSVASIVIPQGESANLVFNYDIKANNHTIVFNKSSNDSKFAEKIGTMKTPSSIGSMSLPVYIDNGEVKPIESLNISSANIGGINISSTATDSYSVLLANIHGWELRHAVAVCSIESSINRDIPSFLVLNDIEYSVAESPLYNIQCSSIFDNGNGDILDKCWLLKTNDTTVTNIAISEALEGGQYLLLIDTVFGQCDENTIPQIIKENDYIQFKHEAEISKSIAITDSFGSNTISGDMIFLSDNEGHTLLTPTYLSTTTAAFNEIYDNELKFSVTAETRNIEELRLETTSADEYSHPSSSVYYHKVTNLSDVDFLSIILKLYYNNTVCTTSDMHTDNEYNNYVPTTFTAEKSYYIFNCNNNPVAIILYNTDEDIRFFVANPSQKYLLKELVTTAIKQLSINDQITLSHGSNTLQRTSDDITLNGESIINKESSSADDSAILSSQTYEEESNIATSQLAVQRTISNILGAEYNSQINIRDVLISSLGQMINITERWNNVLSANEDFVVYTILPTTDTDYSGQTISISTDSDIINATLSGDCTSVSHNNYYCTIYIIEPTDTNLSLLGIYSSTQVLLITCRQII